jgi:dihydropteroate synthase
MTINCKGNLIDLTTPKVMGILNLTPDSFYDGGKYGNEKDILEQTKKMLSEGATFIDVGAYSSRPGAKHITADEELKRIVPVIKLLVTTFPDIILSVDTFRSKVAIACIKEGAAIINDISAGEMDENMFATVAALGVPYIMMHMKGTPQNMQQNPSYDNITEEVIFYFSNKIAQARSFGINDIILDPGFGFGKTIEHNYTLLNEQELLKNIELPLLIGLSRKSMIYKTLNTTAENALNGTTAMHTISLLKGATILRVHDVKEAMECITLTNKLKV